MQGGFCLENWVRKVESFAPRGEAELWKGAGPPNCPRNAGRGAWRKGRHRLKLLERMAEAFDLPAPPQRIEVYDNSHIQGTRTRWCDDSGRTGRE